MQLTMLTTARFQAVYVYLYTLWWHKHTLGVSSDFNSANNICTGVYMVYADRWIKRLDLSESTEKAESD